MASIFAVETVFNVPADGTTLFGRERDITLLQKALAAMDSPTFQLVGDHGVGKSTLIRVVGHRLRGRRDDLNIVYVDCRPSFISGAFEPKSREGLVRDLAVASGGLVGLDETDREVALLRRLHDGKWVVLLDSFETAIGGGAEELARTIGMATTACVVLGSTRAVDWIDLTHTYVVKPLAAKYIMKIIEAAGAPSLRSYDAEAVAAATAGLPDLARRAGRLLRAGTPLAVTVRSVHDARANCYSVEIATAAQSTLYRKVISLGLVVATPLDVASYSGILQIPSAAIADALLHLVEQGLVDCVDRAYRPRDILLSTFDLSLFEPVVITAFLTWLTRFMPDERVFTWSKADIARCDVAAHCVRAFLRMDQMALAGALPSVGAYATHGATLAGWLVSKGYWLELDRLAERVDTALWESRSARSLAKIHLLWRLKALLKRGFADEAWRSLSALMTRLPSLAPPEAEFLRLAVVVCAPQMRRVSDPSPTIVSARTLAALRSTAAAMSEAEILLHGADEFELESISVNRRGNIAAEAGDQQGAAALYMRAEQLALSRSGESWSPEIVAIARGNRGVVLNRTGHWREATRVLTEALENTAQESEIAVTMAELARAAFEMGDARSGRQYWERADHLARRLSARGPACESDSAWRPPKRRWLWFR